MSIEKRIGLSRSFRTLIKKHADLAKHIKDLKDLKSLHIDEGYRH